MSADDRITERLKLLFADLPQQDVQDAVLLFLAQLGLDDPKQLSPKMRARLAAVTADPASMSVRPELLERIALVFAEEKVRSMEAARAKMGGSSGMKKEPPKPSAQRTSVLGILAIKRRSA